MIETNSKQFCKKKSILLLFFFFLKKIPQFIEWLLHIWSSTGFKIRVYQQYSHSILIDYISFLGINTRWYSYSTCIPYKDFENLDNRYSNSKSASGYCNFIFHQWRFTFYWKCLSYLPNSSTMRRMWHKVNF